MLKFRVFNYLTKQWGWKNLDEVVGSSPVKLSVIPVTAVQLEAMASTPVILLNAIPAEMSLVPLWLTTSVVTGSTNYNVDDLNGFSIAALYEVGGEAWEFSSLANLKNAFINGYVGIRVIDSLLSNALVDGDGRIELRLQGALNDGDLGVIFGFAYLLVPIA